MPEYLAPGVYVEETSFRAKSIEGVSTTTTGFVGPTQRGPIGGTPELITSLGDFERIYGGLGNLSFGVNYLAHGVRAYYNEGGKRLYVSRVYLPPLLGDGRARSADFVVNVGDPTEQARIVSLHPGSGGNGRVTFSLLAAQATRQRLERAAEGTFVRVGGASPAGSAQVTGATAPFRVTNNTVLRVNAGAGDIDITFLGTSAESVADDVLPDPVTITPGNETFNVNIDGVQQAIPLPTGPLSRADFVTMLNSRLRGGYARLTALSEPGAAADRLVIGADRHGSLSSVSVSAHPDLEFNAPTPVQGAPGPNNVGDLNNVTAGEINALLTAASAGAVRAGLSSNNRLVIATVATGGSTTLTVGDSGTNSANTALGLTAGDTDTGEDGTAVQYYVKAGSTYLPSAGAALDLNTVGTTAEILTISAVAEDSGGSLRNIEDMSFDRRHPRWIGNLLPTNPTRRSDALENIFAAEIGANVSAFDLFDGLFTTGDTAVVTLAGGSDGREPVQGAVTVPGSYEAALFELEKLEDISIVAAPGSSAYADAQGIQGALITHAEQRKSYRIYVADPPAGQTVTDVRAVKARIDSKYAALYYPWVVVSNPLAQPGDESSPRELKLPPSGFVCGVYARNDIERNVYKAPANEIVRSALRFETDVNFAQQEVLNPLGVNCLRYFVGRGNRVWGARTTSSDPEWKYVNIRRYFNYIERSLDSGTQWAVFEPNGEQLWKNITDTVSSFLENEWVSGALLGKREEAFFVRCDRSTMTQNDLDNGRLICLVGVAVVKPAEFVIFRVGQKTADSPS